MDVVSVLSLGFLALLYFWISYNTPILAVGIKNMYRKGSETKKQARKNLRELPSVSIVVPVKDEERVIGRLLEALLKVDYPPEKKEIVIVEDASTDNTPKICRGYAERYPQTIRFVHRDISGGKPSALNCGFKQSRGEIVAVFDADNVPESNVLRKAAEYFEDPSVAAVQGTTCIINDDQNMLTKFASYEEAVWLKNFLQGKDVLKLFVPLTGSCQFIRKDVVEKLGYWDEDCLAEDLELSARITDNGYSIRYAPDLVSWQEAPSKLSQLISQRIRWFRGYMEVALKYGRFLKKFQRKAFDAEITLIGPYVLATSLLSYSLSIYISLFTVQDPVFSSMAQITILLTAFSLVIAGIAMMYATRPMKVKNILWLPFIYAYWSLHCLLTAYAFLQIIFGRPRKWIKTAKTGESTQDIPQRMSLLGS